MIGGAKFLGMVVFLPLGFHLDGFRGALLGLILSDVVKYATSSVGVARHGLRFLWRDAGMTLAVAAVAWAGHAAGNALAGGGTGRNLLPVVVAALVVAAGWGPALLLYLRQETARRAGTG